MSDPAVLDREGLLRLARGVTSKDQGTATTRELASGLAQTLDVLGTVERALLLARQKADAAANSLRAAQQHLSTALENQHGFQAECDRLRLDRDALRALLQRYRKTLEVIAQSSPVRRFAPDEAKRLRKIAADGLGLEVFGAS